MTGNTQDSKTELSRSADEPAKELERVLVDRRQFGSLRGLVASPDDSQFEALDGDAANEILRL